MPKKVALVDIDGCLVIPDKNGKWQLNKALVEKLRDYDQIILFTQRSKYLQQRQIKSLIQMGDADLSGEIIGTKQIVDELRQALGKEITVSTSSDPILGQSNYAELIQHEDSLIKASSAIKEGNTPPNLALAVIEEQTNIKNKLKESKLDKREFFTDRQIDSQAKKTQTNDDLLEGIYQPQKKVGHYRYLLKSIDKDAQIDYFDDSLENIKELLEIQDLPIVPKCMHVEGDKFNYYSQSMYLKEVLKQIGSDSKSILTKLTDDNSPPSQGLPRSRAFQFGSTVNSQSPPTSSEVTPPKKAQSQPSLPKKASIKPLRQKPTKQETSGPGRTFGKS